MVRSQQHYPYFAFVFASLAFAGLASGLAVAQDVPINGLSEVCTQVRTLSLKEQKAFLEEYPSCSAFATPSIMSENDSPTASTSTSRTSSITLTPSVPAPVR